jgi:hypothetical protein
MIVLFVVPLPLLDAAEVSDQRAAPLAVFVVFFSMSLAAFPGTWKVRSAVNVTFSSNLLDSA